MEKKWLCVSA